VRHRRGQSIEVESVGELDARLATGVRRLSGWRLVGLDLTGFEQRLREVQVGGALFRGCRFPIGLADELRSRGAVVSPGVTEVPVNADRTSLYTAAELYDTPEYAASFDARVYAWSTQPSDRDGRMARALHDNAIDEALTAWTAGRHLVGVMGGHALTRGQPTYAQATRLGHLLAADRTVATGGGPGAMEAANLGAWLADPDTIDAALDLLTAVPAYRPDIGAWAAAGLEVRRRWPEGRESLGIPTWHYGHEPPNVFATAVAKYFRNATREAILLQLCDAGIVFLEGAGGTVQEIFQDACENYYADESSVAPMVLVGRRYWTHDVPAWPLLERLSRGRPMEGHVHLVETVEEAAEKV